MNEPLNGTHPLAGEQTLLSGAEFLRVMFDKLVPLEDAGIEKDLFLYWRKKGLTPYFQKGSWARFSFAQLVWLRMLLDLREFGYSLEKMQALADYLFKRAYEDHLPQRNLEVAQDALRKKELAGTLSEEEKGLQQYLQDTLKEEQLLHALNFNINYLTNLIVASLKSGEEAGVLLFRDGTIAEYVQGEYYSGREAAVDPSAPHIYLSVRHYLREFMDSGELARATSPLQLFSREEQRVLREVRDPKVKEVRVEVRSGRIGRVESTREEVLLGEEVAAIKKVLGLNNYERVTIDTIDEKSLLYRKTKKRV